MKARLLLNKTDFTLSKLPKTRKEQFFDILRNRKRLLFKIGLITLLFSLFFIAVEFFKDSEIISLFVSNNDSELNLEYYNLIFLFESIKTLSYFIFAILLSGLGRIFKNLIWDKPIIFGYDFKMGIKENYKIALILSLFLFILKFLFLLVTYAFSNLDIISYLIRAIDFAIISPLFLTIYFINIFYDNSFKDLFKNSFKFYVISLISIFIKVLFIFLVLIFYEIAPSLGFIALIIKFCFMIIVPLLLFPIYLLACFEHQTYLFDKLINKENFEEFYKKGLYKEVK